MNYEHGKIEVIDGIPKMMWSCPACMVKGAYLIHKELFGIPKIMFLCPKCHQSFEISKDFLKQAWDKFAQGGHQWDLK